MEQPEQAVSPRVRKFLALSVLGAVVVFGAGPNVVKDVKQLVPHSTEHRTQPAERARGQAMAISAKLNATRGTDNTVTLKGYNGYVIAPQVGQENGKLKTEPNATVCARYTYPIVLIRGKGPVPEVIGIPGSSSTGEVVISPLYVDPTSPNIKAIYDHETPYTDVNVRVHQITTPDSPGSIQSEIVAVGGEQGEVRIAYAAETYSTQGAAGNVCVP